MQRPQDRLNIGGGQVIDLAALRDNAETSALEGGTPGKFGYWRIEFTPKLTPAQWQEFREVIGKHNAYIGGFYSKSRVIAALLEVVPNAKILT